MSAAVPTGLFRESVAREKVAWFVHRERLKGGAFLPPKAAPQATFLHGFLLPFSLIVATLRHPTLGFAYLRLLVVRALIVGVLSTIAFHLPNVRPDENKSHRGAPTTAVITDHADETADKEPSAKAAENDDAKATATGEASGTKSDTDEDERVEFLGKHIVLKKHKDKAAKTSASHSPPPPAASPNTLKVHGIPWETHVGPFKRLLDGWSWLVWFVGVVSATEAILVFFSRRWDDWLGFHAAAIAHVRPEEATPKTPKVAFDLRYLTRKLRRRLRGYIVFGSGIPLFFLFRVIPVVGDLLFTVALAGWSWYWLAVFSAAKSAHAWADDGLAPSPALVRGLRDRSSELRVLRPVHLYARLWARLLRSVNAACATFERSPAPFLGLALARIILSLPGLYLLARPIVPVAAGRLIAESDPLDRFSRP